MKLYHYEHCPYCVRVRMVMGWKGLDVEEEVLANADEQRPNELVGCKMVPILQKDDGSCIKESLDIINYIDQTFGKLLLTDRPQDYDDSALARWLGKSSQVIRYLVHPRNIRVFRQDFPTQSDRDYYESKKSQSIGSFDAAFAASAHYMAQLAPLLDELKGLLETWAGAPSYADILLFPVLRSITHVKGLRLPAELGAYVEKISRETKVPLLFEQAL